MAGIDYFNFYHTFVNEVVGSAELFILIMAAVIFGVGSYFKMPWKVSLMLFTTFIIIFAAWTNYYFYFIYYIVALILAFTLRRLYKSYA